MEASLGHIKDLPKNKMGVDLTDGTFEPELIVIPGQGEGGRPAARSWRKADSVYLAPDPDREGEAIAAHLADELRGRSRRARSIASPSTKSRQRP